jgi:hypothetical protein
MTLPRRFQFLRFKPLFLRQVAVSSSLLSRAKGSFLGFLGMKFQNVGLARTSTV